MPRTRAAPLPTSPPVSETDRDPSPLPAAEPAEADTRAPVAASAETAVAAPEAASPASETTGRAEGTGGAVSALHQRIHDLTTDIGAVLHANTSTLFMAHHALDVAIHALAPNPFPDSGTPTTDEVDAALAGPAQAAARAIDKLLQLMAERDEGETSALREELAGSAVQLADFVAHIHIEEIRASTLRSIACRLQEIVDETPPHTFPRETLRQLRQAAHEVERVTALAALLQTRSAILQMDYTIRSFREFVTADLRRREPPRKLRVARLIESAYRQLAEYAHASHVNLRRKHEAPGAEVTGVKRELVRAIANLLHNAIKYSWRRDKGAPAWVEVRVTRQDQHVCLAFENWGVPISSHEIRDGLIFELGYRGQWSTDRGRLGTGVGLTDARDIVQKHKGRLTVESRPARTWGPDDTESDEYYRQPFLTTVTICLPETI
jgi:signal transduction histidine kinase